MPLRPTATTTRPACLATLSLNSLAFNSWWIPRAYHLPLPRIHPSRQFPDCRSPALFYTSSRRQEQTPLPRPRTLPPESNSPTSFALDLETQLSLSTHPPSESQILFALTACQNFVNSQLKPTSNGIYRITPTSAILSLAECSHLTPLRSLQPPTRSSQFHATPDSCLRDISEQNKVFFSPITDLAFKLISHTATFISPKVLSVYVSLQSVIKDPTLIPAVFSLYARKSYTPPGTKKLPQWQF
ncbi:unnamed protein product [Tuber aestivum]|uniref:Uncharacterized protein n=1 Tax=Tuber aestivum TaxID=59557 RepID=A0A292PPX0_9PEZI|nr:unnamed protein product [Tuber aestivum]